MTALPPLRLERPADADAVEALIARAFGPGRYAKAAELLREGNRPRLELSVVAWDEAKAVGSARLWPVTIGQAPALLLGPFAVDEAYRRQGLGAALARHACETAATAGHGLVMLVGDEAYFAPLGFSAQPARRVIMPGPVDQRRVLVRALSAGADQGLAGEVRAGADGEGGPTPSRHDRVGLPGVSPYPRNTSA